MRDNGPLVHQAQQIFLGKLEGGEVSCGQRPALRPQRLQSGGVSLLPGGGVVVIHLLDLGGHVLGSQPERLQGGLVGLHIHTGLGHQSLIHRGEDAVILGGEVQAEGGGLVDVHGKGAVILQVEIHNGPIVGAGGIVLAVVDVHIEGEDGLHVLLEEEAVHRGGHTGGVVGEVVRVGIGLVSIGEYAVGEAALGVGGVGVLVGEVVQHGVHLGGGVGAGVGAELVGGQLEVEEGQGLAHPLGVNIVDHLPGAHGPVVLGVGGAPLLGAVEAEDNVVFGLVAGVDHGLRHGQHQAHGAVVILEAGEVDVIMAAHDDLIVGGSARDAAHDIVGGAVLGYLVVHHQGGGDGAVYRRGGAPGDRKRRRAGEAHRL